MKFYKFLVIFALFFILVEAASAKEADQIEKFKETVKREGDTLFLKTGSGSFVTLKNNPECEGYGNCHSYEFEDYYKDIGFYLIDHNYWEGGGVMMISQSDGEIYQISDMPIFSPDKKYLVTVPSDPDTGYYDNGVYVWRIEDGKLIDEFSYTPTEYATYGFLKWKDNTLIELKKWLRSSKGLCPEYKYMKIPVSLKVEGNNWKMYEDLLPSLVQCVNSL